MAADYFGSKYFAGGYFPDGYFGTVEDAASGSISGVASGVATCSATLTVVEEKDEARKAGIGRKRRIPVVDMIWPEDPRHPNYIAPAPAAEPQPEVRSNVIRVDKKAAPRVVEPEVKIAPRYDVELALLLLAA